jgi:hypothetical protein
MHGSSGEAASIARQGIIEVVFDAVAAFAMFPGPARASTSFCDRLADLSARPSGVSSALIDAFSARLL